MSAIGIPSPRDDARPREDLTTQRLIFQALKGLTQKHQELDSQNWPEALANIVAAKRTLSELGSPDLLQRARAELKRDYNQSEATLRKGEVRRVAEAALAPTKPAGSQVRAALMDPARLAAAAQDWPAVLDIIAAELQAAAEGSARQGGSQARSAWLAVAAGTEHEPALKVLHVLAQRRLLALRLRIALPLVVVGMIALAAILWFILFRPGTEPPRPALTAAPATAEVQPGPAGAVPPTIDAPSATATATTLPTDTPTHTSTPTHTPTWTPTATDTPTVTPTATPFMGGICDLVLQGLDGFEVQAKQILKLTIREGKTQIVTATWPELYIAPGHGCTADDAPDIAASQYRLALVDANVERVAPPLQQDLRLAYDTDTQAFTFAAPVSLTVQAIDGASKVAFKLQRLKTDNAEDSWTDVGGLVLLLQIDVTIQKPTSTPTASPTPTLGEITLKKPTDGEGAKPDQLVNFEWTYSVCLEPVAANTANHFRFGFVHDSKDPSSEEVDFKEYEDIENGTQIEKRFVSICSSEGQYVSLQRGRGGLQPDRDWLWTVVVVDKKGEPLTRPAEWRRIKFESEQAPGCSGEKTGECDGGWKCKDGEWVCDRP